MAVPGTAAPVGSLTCPEMLPAVCAINLGAIAVGSISTRSAKDTEELHNLHFGLSRELSFNQQYHASLFWNGKALARRFAIAYCSGLITVVDLRKSRVRFNSAHSQIWIRSGWGRRFGSGPN